MTMNISPMRAHVLIADAGTSPWTRSLAETLQPWPVDVHWSRSDVEAIGMASATGIHVAVVDNGLPSGGGLGLLRRVRNLGMGFPCLLVSEAADPRLLQAALELGVFSVLTSTQRNLLTPMVLKVFRKVYQFDWMQSIDTN